VAFVGQLAFDERDSAAEIGSRFDWGQKRREKERMGMNSCLAGQK
jgi:hypothetical protein